MSGTSQAAVVGGAIVMGSLAGMILGALGGLVSGSITCQNQKRVEEEAKLALPTRVVASRHFSDPLLTMAKCSPKFDKDAFRHLADKIESMLLVAQQLHEALPASVTPAMALVGTQYEVRVRDLLQTFYRRSHVLVVRKAAEGKGTHDVEPVNRDMKLAHQVLMDSTMHLADAMEALAKDKHQQALTEKEFKWQPRRPV